MTDGGRAEPEPPDDQGNRSVENAVMLGFFVVLVAAGIWLPGTSRYTKGSGLRRPRAPELCNDRGSRPGAIDAFL
jgi:hypothetical protein